MIQADTPRLDKTWLYGILLLVVSLFVFFIPIFIHINGDTDGLFAANYLIVIFYFGVICWNHRMSIREQNGLAPHLVFLVLSLVSCYALNRTICVLNINLPWWPALLIVTSVKYLSMPFYFSLPRSLQMISCTIAGVAFIAFLYIAIQLLPAYLLGGLCILVFGLGLHVFVPSLFVVYTIAFIRHVGAANRSSFYAFGIGVLIALIAFLQFVDLKNILRL